MQSFGTVETPLESDQPCLRKQLCGSPKSADTCSSEGDCQQGQFRDFARGCGYSTQENYLSGPQYQTRIRRGYGDGAKQKSELCKTFVEHGYCPYNHKCKFAHGSHELRQNQEFNCRYKTKKCSSFFKQGYCMYGIRCNFVHSGLATSEMGSEPAQKKWEEILQHSRPIIYEARNSSRLLQLLAIDGGLEREL